jgi:hypothetical protein
LETILLKKKNFSSLTAWIVGLRFIGCFWIHKKRTRIQNISGGSLSSFPSLFHPSFPQGVGKAEVVELIGGLSR